MAGFGQSLLTIAPENCVWHAGELGLIPHDQPSGPLLANLAAFWQQISPIVPVLPTVPTHKSCAVYNLAFEAFHGMEEVIGSIPIRSTIPLFFSRQFGPLFAPPSSFSP
jgi:hypothetical protein